MDLRDKYRSEDEINKEIKHLDHLIEDTEHVIIGWKKSRETLKKLKEKLYGSI